MKEITPPKYPQFIHPTLNTSTLFAWLEVPIDFMDTEVPESAPYSTVITKEAPYVEPVFDEEGNDITEYPEPETRQKLLKEYVPYKVSLDGTKAVFRLSALDKDTYRARGIKEDGMALWEQFLPAYGYPFDTVMGIEAYEALIRSADYTAEEE